MSSESQYEKLYYALLEGLEKMHEKNVKRTKNTLRTLIIIPTIFLILLFFSNAAEYKTIFMVLWILSMFVIAAILIVIEYQDYQLKNVFNTIRASDTDSAAVQVPVIEDSAPVVIDAPASEKLEQYDELRRDIEELSKDCTEETEATAQ